MDSILIVINNIFSYVLRLSCMGSVVVIFILAVRLIFRKNMSSKLKYILWFILIFRLALPVTPDSNMSIFNYMPTKDSYISTIDTSHIEKENFINSNRENFLKDSFTNTNINPDNSYTNMINNTKEIKGYSLKDVFITIWISGMIIGVLTIFMCYINFLRSTKKCSRVSEVEVLQLFRECKILMNVHKNIILIESNNFKSPCIMGVFKPKILIPHNLINSSKLKELRFALIHELAHVKRKDILVNYIIAILCIIYWFNPLVWYGFYKMREDREVCCDSLALSNINDEEVYEYGLAVISFAATSSKLTMVPATAGFASNKSKLKRRINMIRKFKKGSYQLSFIAIVLLIAASFILLTDAKVNAQSPDETVGEPKKVQEKVLSTENRIVDKIDYPFINDEDFIGKWEVVDFVGNIENFTPGIKSWRGGDYLKSITVLPDGKMKHPIATEVGESDIPEGPVAWLTWTKGYIIHHGNTTASAYTIKAIDGETYMFQEWKSGDYTIRGQKPLYYVYKKAN